MNVDADRIRQRAYDIWIAEGCPAGKDAEHWDRAKRELASETNGVSASDNGGNGPTQNVQTGSNGINETSEENTSQPAPRKRLHLNVSDDRAEA